MSLLDFSPRIPLGTFSILLCFGKAYLNNNKNKKKTLWSFNSPIIYWIKIVTEFRGMHVLPAKHSYVWLPRKTDYRTDREADRQTDRHMHRQNPIAVLFHLSYRCMLHKEWKTLSQCFPICLTIVCYIRNGKPFRSVFPICFELNPHPTGPGRKSYWFFTSFTSFICCKWRRFFWKEISNNKLDHSQVTQTRHDIVKKDTRIDCIGI